MFLEKKVLHIVSRKCGGPGSLLYRDSTKNISEILPQSCRTNLLTKMDVLNSGVFLFQSCYVLSSKGINIEAIFI